jgi:flagellar motor switch protein FliN
MAADVSTLLKLEVPVIVVLGQRMMPVKDVVALVPGAIIELPKKADEDLALLVNNKQIGNGRAVKIGENFGIRLNFMGDVRQRLEAMGTTSGQGKSAEELEAEAMAEAMLAGQI